MSHMKREARNVRVGERFECVPDPLHSDELHLSLDLRKG
jgi:hypothetical protein